MYKEIQYEDLEKDKLKGSFQLIDVRSPKEYNSETIPGSINLPIFTDEERAEIGTEYKNGSINEAKKIGIKAACKKLPDLFDKVLELDSKFDYLVFFCARGGYRSRAMVSLSKSLGLNVIKLEGGYKGYRHFINENLPNEVRDIKFIVLYGNSGSGKTDILKCLKELGCDVLDLEECANHRGSVLGGVGLGSPNTQKMFESLVYDKLKNRKSNIVFTEGESKRIGRIIMPEYLYNSIKSGENIKIEADMDIRVNNIYKEYAHGIENDEAIIYSLNYLRRNIGNKRIDEYIKMIKEHNYNYVIQELLTNYYDPLYEYRDRKYVATFDNVDPIETAKEIIEKCK
ncbi:MAG: tRNA 2-selenouridine(34) synthase MnmH [Tissierellaceae bacterium]|nr:tRNA 2-selenouridine(34) synthase MnmH [Tissierellaceae bacterium]